MPAKKPTRPTRTRSKKVAVKKQNYFNNIPILGKLVSNKPALFIILGVAALGVFLLFRAGAATTNFEAESATQAGGAKSGLSDVTASGGKYAQFATSSSSTSKVSRFPGDPNPLVTGKAYWGASIDGNGDPVPRHENPTGKSLSIRRTFWSFDKASGMINTAKADIAANRLPHVSVKTPSDDWAGVASGKYDATLDDMLRKLDALGGPVWFTVHHEPENDGLKASDWRAMQQHVRDRMNAIGTKNIAFMPVLMSWTWNTGQSKRNPEDWWVPGIWDAYMVDPYSEAPGYTIMTTNKDATGWNAFAAWSEAKKLPYGTAEWGARTISGGSYESDCKTLRATTDQQESTAGSVVRQTWEWGFQNKKDVIAHQYFDSCLNSASGGWKLGGQQLAAFHDILKNDSRVQRIKDLPAGQSVQTYGTMTANVTVPTSSTYKIWVRMSAPDANNNAVQLQVDSGAAIKVGDAGLPPNTWTWVGWKNGNTSDAITTALSAGTRKVTLTGIEPGVKIDRVLITDETCQPTGMGDECTVITPPATPPPSSDLNINIVNPKSGQTVSGVTQVSVEPATNVQEVSFRVNGVWQTTDKDAPFTWADWDTAKFPNGSTTVTIRARKVGDPGNKYTEKSVVVKVVNGTSQPVADTTPPTKPANLTATTSFSGTKLRYVMNLSWTPSTDNTGVAKYTVERDGVKLGEATTNTFVDTSEITANKPYQYSVTALDAGNNASTKASMTVQSTCFLIWCTTSVL